MDDDVLEWETLMSTRLIGIGTWCYEATVGATGYLFVATDGRIFGWEDYCGDFFYYADSLHQFRFFAQLRRPRVMMLPFLDTTVWYGEKISRGDPRIYDPNEYGGTNSSESV